MTTVDLAVLDNPVWGALLGVQRPFASVRGQAARYLPEVSPFAAVEDAADPAAWADLAALAGPEETLLVPGAPEGPVPGWELIGGGRGVQLTGEDLVAAPDPEVVRLGEADVPEMLDLVARTRPGPFGPRTRELGSYLGIRRNGVLAAMAGERVRPPGWTEISAVCTDPAYRGQGLANRLVRAVAAVVRERGERPFLHAAGNNENAIRLYLAMGFRHRRDINFHAYRKATR
ncbi:GNAT family N-acetyltransferase [Actinoplanes sp. LDG1-06]|uniref:GNAT family N-acetyltransferase n=1 Tax=Paractinoplanes ovalisporus TaxID=2810368 RepID=A0ABS2AEZ9_9ACTN|nr:GNAT family N-acetyltransferase [Actinoplanes ovalisporus]MBM2618384.1 GNAT family N-acetyltransferase [Actinoplanes ovalisporus]